MFFLFKQKTADGMRISDWSSDVCASDLRESIRLEDLIDRPFMGMQRDSALLSLYRQQVHALGWELDERAHATSFESIRHMVALGSGVEIGRASCRERVCQYV